MHFKNKVRLVFLLGLLSQIAAYAQKYVDGIVAIVGEKVILRSEFESDKVSVLQSMAVKDSSKIDCYVLQQLIIRKLLSSQAELDSLPLEDSRVDAEIDNRIRNYERQAGSQEELEKYLGMSVSAYKTYIFPKMREQLLMQEMQQKVTGETKITPSEVKIFFDSINKDSIPLVPMEIELAQMIMQPPISEKAKAKAKYKIDGLRKRILKGESFESLARIYSEDPGSKEEGGLLPEFSRGEMVPQFERMAFISPIDSISEVFESSFGFHFLKVIKRNGEKVIARHILIKPAADQTEIDLYAKKIDSVYQDLKYGRKTWCDAVKENAHKEYGNRGNCGFIQDENTGYTKILFEALSPEMKGIAAKMKPGEISKPELVPVGDGTVMFIMLYLKSQTEPHEMNLQQDYPRILAEAENQKKQKVLEEWVEKSRKKNNIRINTQFLNCETLKNWNTKI